MKAECFGGPRDGWMLEFKGGPPSIYQFPYISDKDTTYDVYLWNKKEGRYIYRPPEPDGPPLP